MQNTNEEIEEMADALSHARTLITDPGASEGIEAVVNRIDSALRRYNLDQDSKPFYCGPLLGMVYPKGDTP